MTDRIPLVHQARPHRDFEPGSGKSFERLRKKTSSWNSTTRRKIFSSRKVTTPQYGARPMRRAVERFFEDPLAEEILKGVLHEGDLIQVTADKDKLLFNQKPATEGAVAS